MKRETTGKATGRAPMLRMRATTSVDPTMPATLAPAPCFRNPTKDRRRVTCSRTVFKAHRPAPTHLNTRPLPPLLDPRRPAQDRRLRQASRRHLKTPLAHLTTDLPAADPSDHPRAMARSSDDPEALVPRSVHSSGPADLTISSEAARPSWDPPDRHSMAKDIRWAVPGT